MRSISLILASLSLLSAQAGLRASEPVPAAPDGLILDQSRVLLPSQVAELGGALQAAAREQSIWIYVITVPSLHVPPSLQGRQLVEVAHFYTDHWLRDRVGMVILFDDESGVEIVVASREAERRFPKLKLAMAMSAPLRHAERALLSRDKVEGTAMAVLDEISGLRDRAQKAARRDRVINWGMLAIAVGGMTVVVLAEWRKAQRQRPQHSAASG